MHIVFVRHGQTTAEPGVCIGRTDVGLSADGLLSIRSLAAAWHALGDRGMLPAPSRIIASDLRRAVDSAQVFGLLWNLDVERDARLREIDFGDWERRTWDSISASDAFQAWSDRWMEVAPPNGEALPLLKHRSDAWIRDVCFNNALGDQTIVAVAHAGWIRATVTSLLGRPLDRMFDLPIDPAHAMVVRMHGKRGELVAVNVAAIP